MVKSGKKSQTSFITVIKGGFGDSTQQEGRKKIYYRTTGSHREGVATLYKVIQQSLVELLDREEPRREIPPNK